MFCIRMCELYVAIKIETHMVLRYSYVGSCLVLSIQF